MVLKSVLLQGPWHGTEACAVTGPLDALADGGLPGRQSRVHRVLRHKKSGTQDHREMAPIAYRSAHYKRKLTLIFSRSREK